MAQQEFFMPMILPRTTYQQHRVSVKKIKKKSGAGSESNSGKDEYLRPVFYDTPEIRAAREKYLAFLTPHKPEAPYNGPIRLRVIFCFQAGNTKGHHHGDFKITKPDTDNMLKLFKDCMTKAGFWHDDAQVAQEWTEKRYCDVPGVYVAVQEITPNIKADGDDFWDDV